MIDPETLRQAIENSGARWQAIGYGQETAETEFGLGYVPEGEEPSLERREAIAVAELPAFLLALESGVAQSPEPFTQMPRQRPSSFDWRNVNGANYVTPPKAQGRCGSCVAFATAGVVEAAVRIARQDAGLRIDLSEAHLFFCYAAAQGRRCNNGWYVTAGLQACQQGVADEDCFRYGDSDRECSLCRDWQQRVTRISGHTRLANSSDMRSWLSSRGPVVTAFTVYEDFFSYSSGIYSHVTGGAQGGHAVLCVGYDDTNRYWICKNSWGGTSWGESGFFRIAYGNCGIDASMWGVNGIA